MMMSLFDQDRLLDLYGEEKIREGEAKGEAKGRAEERYAMARKLYAVDWPAPKIAEFMGVNLDTVESWLAEPVRSRT